MLYALIVPCPADHINFGNVTLLQSQPLIADIVLLAFEMVSEEENKMRRLPEMQRTPSFDASHPPIVANHEDLIYASMLEHLAPSMLSVVPYMNECFILTAGSGEMARNSHGPICGVQLKRQRLIEGGRFNRR
jgi:hypothetical protein